MSNAVNFWCLTRIEISFSSRVRLFFLPLFLPFQGYQPLFFPAYQRISVLPLPLFHFFMNALAVVLLSPSCFWSLFRNGGPAFAAGFFFPVRVSLLVLNQFWMASVFPFIFPPSFPNDMVPRLSLFLRGGQTFFLIFSRRDVLESFSAPLLVFCTQRCARFEVFRGAFLVSLCQFPFPFSLLQFLKRVLSVVGSLSVWKCRVIPSLNFSPSPSKNQPFFQVRQKPRWLFPIFGTVEDYCFINWLYQLLFPFFFFFVRIAFFVLPFFPLSAHVAICSVLFFCVPLPET